MEDRAHELRTPLIEPLVGEMASIGGGEVASRTGIAERSRQLLLSLFKLFMLHGICL